MKMRRCEFKLFLNDYKNFKDFVIEIANKKAKEELGWTAKKTLDDMTADSYNWQKNNPNGYED